MESTLCYDGRIDKLSASKMLDTFSIRMLPYESLAADMREPDRDTATALLYGLKMDTLQFTRGVTELDIKMFGYLFPRCDQGKLADLERNDMEFADLKAYGAAIESIPSLFSLPFCLHLYTTVSGEKTTRSSEEFKKYCLPAARQRYWPQLDS